MAGAGAAAPSDSCAMPVTKSDSIFPKGRPTPVLVRLPEDDGFDGEEDGEGGTGVGSMLLLAEKLEFSEVHEFSRHVSGPSHRRRSCRRYGSVVVKVCGWWGWWGCRCRW